MSSTNIPVNNLRDLVAYSKANPGKLNQAQAGSINPDIAILRHKLGMGPVEDVVYKGGPLAVTAIVAGEAQFYGASIVDVVQLEKAGKLRALVYTERERHPMMPHIPSVADAGIDGYEGGYWFLLAAPAGTPPDVLTRLNGAAREMVKEPEMMERAKGAATSLYSSTLEQTRQRVDLRFKAMQDAINAGVKLR